MRPLGAKGLIDAFLEARLFTGDQDAEGRSTVMVAHEALLRVWPRVVKWVRDNRDFLRQRARLGQALEQWKTRDRHEDYLLARGLPLAEAESLLKQHEAALSEEEVTYIRASRAKAQREELRRKKVRRAVVTGLSLLTLAATLAAVWAILTNVHQQELLWTAQSGRPRGGASRICYRSSPRGTRLFRPRSGAAAEEYDCTRGVGDLRFRDLRAEIHRAIDH